MTNHAARVASSADDDDMSNTETTPTETRCEGGPCPRDGAGRPVVEILTAREVPLAVANPTDEVARAILLGGRPFGEQIVMWWNFVGRDHDEIAGFREEWQAESERFGQVEGYRGAVARLPAPSLPTVRMVPRRNAPTANPGIATS